MTFLEPAANPGSMCFDQPIVSATGCENIHDLPVIETGKKNSTTEKGLVDAAQGCDVYLGVDLELLAVFVHLL
jgi:hypothetical protein